MSEEQPPTFVLVLAGLTIAAMAITVALTPNAQVTAWMCEQIFGPRPRFGYIEVLPPHWSVETWSVETRRAVASDFTSIGVGAGQAVAIVLDADNRAVCVFDGKRVEDLRRRY